MRYLLILLLLFTTSTALAGYSSALYVLNNTDAEKLYGGFQYALSSSPDHQAVDWINRGTGLRGSTVPLRSFQTSYGQVCREYMSSVQLDGSLQQAFGTACRQNDGRWKIAAEKPVVRAQQPLRFALVDQGRQQSCPYADQAAQNKQMMKSQKNFHSDQFHKKYRTLRKGNQSVPDQQKMERQPPAKLLKLVTY